MQHPVSDVMSSGEEPTERGRVPHNRRPHYMRQWRETHNYTLKEMAEEINERAGRWNVASEGMLGRIEKGERQYKQDILEAYADVFGVEPADILSRQPSDPQEFIRELMTTKAGKRLIADARRAASKEKQE
jgi:transcriptional regulator with XRE-family HTH domain